VCALFRDGGDFAEIFGVASENLNLPASAIEKDYWVTQALRGLVSRHRKEFIFKGGTSLSKAYGLIQRFSEDIDILVITDGKEGKGAIDKRLKAMGESAASAVGCREVRKRSGRGKHRTVELDFGAKHPPEGITDTILLEMGTGGGIRPHAEIAVGTLIGDVLLEQGQTEEDEHEDLARFEVPVLHPGRTLIEKVILVSTAAERHRSGDLSEDAIRQMRVGRHFYDIHCLLEDQDVVALLKDREEFERICVESIEISRREYDDVLARPAEGYGRGPAFIGASAETLETLAGHYETIMDAFYYGELPYPSFKEIQERVAAESDLL
jgi:hypothetical protein